MAYREMNARRQLTETVWMTLTIDLTDGTLRITVTGLPSYQAEAEEQKYLLDTVAPGIIAPRINESTGPLELERIATELVVAMREEERRRSVRPWR